MKKTKGEPLGAVFWVLTALSCVVTVCLQMTVTALPLWTVAKGYDTGTAGLSTTLCTLAALGFRPAAARCARRLGEKRCALVGAGSYVAVFFLCLFCQDLVALLLLRSWQGVGMSLLTTALGAMVTAVLPSDAITKGMGLFGLGNAVALSFGPALGLWLAGSGDFVWLFAVGLGLSVGLLVVLWALPAGPWDQVEKEPPTQKRPAGFWQLCRLSGALGPSGLSFGLVFCQMALSNYLSFWGQEQQVDGVSVFFTLNLFGMVVSRLCLGGICQRFGEKLVGLSAAGLLIAAYAGLALWPDIGAVWLGGVLFGFGYGILYALLNAAAVAGCRQAGMSPGEQAAARSAANAAFFGAKDLGTALGSMGWGLVLGQTGAGPLYGICALLTGAGAVLYGCGRIKKKGCCEHEKA